MRSHTLSLEAVSLTSKIRESRIAAGNQAMMTYLRASKVIYMACSVLGCQFDILKYASFLRTIPFCSLLP